MERKCYIIVVIQALVVCLICPPPVLGPAAVGLQVYISGRPLVPVLQLLHVALYVLLNVCYTYLALPSQLLILILIAIHIYAYVAVWAICSYRAKVIVMESSYIACMVYCMIISLINRLPCMAINMHSCI